MIHIKFSHKYNKMPSEIERMPTQLVAIMPCWQENMSKEFIEWDTAYPGGNYRLPEGKLLMLFLATKAEGMKGIFAWTTLRSWSPEKEAYYKSHLGEQVQIKIEEEQHGNTTT